MRPPPHSAALRRGRASLPGQAYLLTTTTWNRAPLFREHMLARTASRALTDRRLWCDASLLAWVLMPDHWHGLVVLDRPATLAAQMRRLKCNSARQCAALLDGQRVWARGYHDHALRSAESLRRAARYLVANPIRAGLVQRVGDWPYWDAVWLQHGWLPDWQAPPAPPRSHG